MGRERVRKCTPPMGGKSSGNCKRKEIKLDDSHGDKSLPQSDRLPIMDEIDRFCEETYDIAAPTHRISSSNARPPVGACDDNDEPFDEVDRPNPKQARGMNETQRNGKSVTDDVFTPVDTRPNRSVSQDLAAMPAPDERELEESGQGERPVGGMLVIDHSNEDSYVVIDTPADSEQVDGPSVPDSSAAKTSSFEPQATDGPFDRLYGKTSKPLGQTSSSKDSEGIVTTHTTYFPSNKPAQPMHFKIDSSSFYKMDTFPRGKLILINQKHFRKNSGMAEYPREGTNRDAEALTSLFLDLGFIVERHDNVTKRDMVNIVKVAANESYRGMSCFACAILSHGEEGIIYGTDGYARTRDISQVMKSPTLVGKPKFVIIQACQGSEYMESVDAVDGPPRKNQDTSVTLPSEADFLYAYSTVPGFYSWRNSKRGSWFVQGLVQVFRDNVHKMDVSRMFTRVNALVATRKSRTDDYVTDNKRQIASIVSQLRRELFLFPPNGPLDPIKNPTLRIDV